MVRKMDVQNISLVYPMRIGLVKMSFLLFGVLNGEAKSLPVRRSAGMMG
jgi:hypothetical protein